MNHGVVSHAGNTKVTKYNYHIVELGQDRYKLQIKKFGMWFYVRKGLKRKIFEDFSDVVRDIQRRKK